MAKKPTETVVTASRTDDGAPVYLTEATQWSRSLAEARVFADEAAAAASLEIARGQERQVCDPYTIPVRVDAGRPVPVSARERIRSEGPTTRLRRPDPAAA